MNLGFIDYGGASIVHIMGGLAGFIGTYLIGPRVGLFRQDDNLAFILEDQLLDDEVFEFERLENDDKGADKRKSKDLDTSKV